MGYIRAPRHPSHSTAYYSIVHGGIFLAETAVMGLMGWVMSPPTQAQLTGGDDATGNMPGFVFLMSFFSQLFSLITIGLWMVDVYNPPLLRACIQTFILLPANAIVGFLLAYQTNWTVFKGQCQAGTVLCKSIWKTAMRIEGVTSFIIGAVVILTLVDIVAALRLWRQQKQALQKLVRMTGVKNKRMMEEGDYAGAGEHLTHGELR